MDFAVLQDVTWRAGFRIDWPALIRLSGRHPEPVVDWIAAAGQYAAADTGHRLLTATAATLRDLIAGTGPGQLYQYADQLDRVPGPGRPRPHRADPRPGRPRRRPTAGPTATEFCVG